MSLLVATQITAIATGVLAFFAIVTAIFAILAFQKQSAEVATLQADSARDAEQRRRAQAAKVFVTTGSEQPDLSDEVRVRNTSEQPIYDLVAASAGHPALMSLPYLIPGGTYPVYTGIRDAEGAMPLVWLDFRDAAGLRWRTTSRGELTECGGRPDKARRLRLRLPLLRA